MFPLSDREVDRGSSTGHKVPLSTASVTADSVGPAAPGIVQRCNKNCSSSTPCSGQAHSRASQGGSYNWAWGNLGPALRRRGRSEIKHRAQGTAQHSIIVTSGSVGPAAPGAAKRGAKNSSSSTLCSGQAHSRASQRGSCNWEWGQMLWSSTAGMELAGSSLKTSRDRLRLPAQGGWSLSRVLDSDVAALSG